MASGGEGKEKQNWSNVAKRRTRRKPMRDSGIEDTADVKMVEEESPPKLSWDYENLYFAGKGPSEGVRLPEEMRSQRGASMLRTPHDSRTPRGILRSRGRTPVLDGSFLDPAEYEDNKYPISAKSETKSGRMTSFKLSTSNQDKKEDVTVETNRQSIEMLQDDLVATLNEVIRLQEDFKKVTDAKAVKKSSEERNGKGIAADTKTKSTDSHQSTNRELAHAENVDSPLGISKVEQFRRPKITPSNFDGTSPWMDFKVHFEYCAELNEWSEKERCLFLAVSLRGAAQQVLSNLSSEKKDNYKDLVGALEKRFAPPNIEELYKSELRMRQRKPGESLLELGQAVRRLVTLAYPKAPQEVLDTLAKDSFLNSLTESEVRLKILRARPVTFDETLQIAVELDACMRAEEKRTGKWSKMVREVDTENCSTQNDDKDTELRKLKSELQELKQLMQQQMQWRGQVQRSRGGKRTSRSDIVCFTCNQKGHISRECPQRERQRKTHNEQESTQKKSDQSSVPTYQIRSGCLTSIDSGLYIPTKVNGIDANFIVDSGASVTIVSYETYDAIPTSSQPKLQATRHVLTLADGKTLETRGSTIFEFRIGEKIIKHEAVVAAIRGSGILGLDFMIEHKCMLDLKSMTLKFEYEVINVHLEQNMQCCRVSLNETSVIPARSECIVMGNVIDRDSKRPLPLFGIVEPCQTFSQKTKTMMGRSLVSADAGGAVPLRILNLHDDPLVVYKGTVAGVFEPIRTTLPSNNEEPTQDTSLPGHIQNLLDDAENLSPSQRKQAESFLLKHAKLFAEKGTDQGHTTLIKHKINTENEKPIRQQPRRVPFHLKKEIDDQIDNMLTNNIIRPSSSPWASPVVLVRKKDGTLRFCIDFRRLNNVTVKDAYPLPRIDESLDALGGSKWFSTLDMMSGYWQIEVDEHDKQKTAFTSHRGLFEFNVMPFGLCNAAGTFERLMQTVCAGLRWDICLIYLDDIIVFSSTFEQHLERLDTVFKRLHAAGLRLRSKKCSLFKHRVSYLGHIITEQGVETDPGKVRSIQTWPTPTNVGNLRSFHGLCSYYRRFVKGFATVASPLHNLTHKDKKFLWTKECETAFQDLKRALTTAPILALPDFSETFILDTDASGVGIGAVLSQSKDGIERVISYGSRSLTKSEKKYSITRKELLAVVHFIKAYRPYLYGRHFVLRTDHSALKWMMSFKEPEGQLARWLDTLSEYDFEICHRAGRLHGNADALSRIDHEAMSENKCNMKPVAAITMETSEHDIKRQQADDSEIAEVKKWVENNKKPDWNKVSTCNVSLKAYWAQFDQLSIRDGILYRDWYTNNGKVQKEQAVVPYSLRPTIMKYCHDAPSGGHLGRQKTLTKIKQKFYWPGMDRDVRKWCASCYKCAKRKKYGKTPRAPMQVTGVGEPGERVAMDILGPVPTSHRGNKYILVIQDYFTKWAEAVPLQDMEAQTVARAFIDNFVTKFGVPRTLHTDQGRQFESRLFQQLCEILEINKTRTTPYHPQSDGMVERMNRTLENMIAAYVDSNQKNWDDQLQLVCMAYRAAQHESSGFTPNYLTFGREIVLPVELLAGLPAQKKSTDQYISNLEDSLALAHDIARKNLGESLKRQKRRYDSKLSWKKFDIGSKVWLYTPRRMKGISPKFQMWWTGPYTVLKKFSDVTYQIVKGKECLVVHVDRLKPYISREESQEPTTQNFRKQNATETPHVPDVIIDPISAPYIEYNAETVDVNDAADSEDQKIHSETTTRSKRRCRKPRHFEDFQLYHVRESDKTSKGGQSTPSHLQSCSRMARTKNTVRKVTAMHKCPLCIEMFQSPEEVLEHIGLKHDKRIKCDHCEYTSERTADMKRHYERRHSARTDQEKPKQKPEDDGTIRRRTQPMPVFTPKRDKPATHSHVQTSVSCEARTGLLQKDAAVQCDRETPTVCDASTQCDGVAVKKRRISETEWTEFN